MNWLPGKTQYYEITDDGRYTVAKIGGDRGPTYEPHFGKERLAIGYITADAAKTHCDSHAERLAAEQARAAA